MDVMIDRPKISTLYEPSRRASWFCLPTASIVSVINEVLKSALVGSQLHPKDQPIMIEIKE